MLLLAVGFALLGPGGADGAVPCTRTWDGGASTNAWDTEANWFPDGVPTAEDHVCIPDVTPNVTVTHSTGGTDIRSLTAVDPVEISGGTLNLTDTTNPSSADDFTLSGGTLGGAGTLVVNATATWADGTMTDAGTTRIAPGASLVVPGHDFKTLSDARTLRNEGSVIWSGAGEIWGVAATFENAGTFDARGTGSLRALDGFTLRNTGVVTRTQGGEPKTLEADFDNDGIVTAGVGTLRLAGSGTLAGSGSFGASGSGSVVLDEGTFTFANGGSLNGGATLDGAMVTVVAGATATVSGANRWLDNAIEGPGTMRVLPGATLSVEGDGSKSLDGNLLLRNEGSLVWSGEGPIFGQAATLENVGTFDVRATGGLLFGAGGPLVLRNTGTMTRTQDAGIAELGAEFENDGVVTAEVGTLRLFGSGTLAGSGSFGASGSGSVVLDSGPFVFGDGASLSGGATLDGATVTVVDGATASISGTNRWLRGVLGGPGTTIVEAGATFLIEGGFLQELGSGHLLHNEGTVVQSDGTWLFEPGAVFENFGTFGAESWVSASIFGARPKIYNAGLLTKTLAADSTQFLHIDTVNDGTIAVQRGTLDLISFTSRFPHTPESRLKVELRGLVQGQDFGLVDVNGTVDLNGTLEIVTAPGFDPEVGDSFTVLTYGDRNGEFAAIQGAEIDASKAYQVQYGPGGVTLTVVATGGGGGVPADAPRIEQAVEAWPALAVTGLTVRTVRARRHIAFRLSRPARFRGRLERVVRARVNGKRRTRFVLARRLPDLILAAGPQRIRTGVLRSGRYRVRLVVSDASGSVTKTAAFRVRRSR